MAVGYGRVLPLMDMHKYGRMEVLSVVTEFLIFVTKVLSNRDCTYCISVMLNVV